MKFITIEVRPEHGAYYVVETTYTTGGEPKERKWLFTSLEWAELCKDHLERLTSKRPYYLSTTEGILECGLSVSNPVDEAAWEIIVSGVKWRVVSVYLSSLTKISQVASRLWHGESKCP